MTLVHVERRAQTARGASYPFNHCLSGTGKALKLVMKYVWAASIALVLPLLTLVLPTSGLAVTLNASSPSLSDVSSAVSLAAAGDTVRVPAGTANWTAPLIIGKAIDLIGAGTNATFITNGISGGYPPLIEIALTSGVKFRVSGMFIDMQWLGGGSAISIVTASGGQYSWLGYSNIAGFRIDHCTFNRCASVSSGGTIQVGGRAWGVLDHCAFYNCAAPVEINGNPRGPADRSWSPFIGDDDWTYMPAPYYYLGSTNNFVMEDCRIERTFAGNGELASMGGFQSGWSTHYVMRYCVVTNGFANTMQDVNDLHGNKACDGTYRGAVCYECYGNIFYMPSDAYRIMNLRGGTCMVFSNQVFGASVACASIQICEEETYAGSDPVNNGCTMSTIFPRMDQITNSFFWANTFNGAAYTYPVENPLMPAGYFQEGRDYWRHAPNSTNVLKDYTPLTYPHPLVAAQDGMGQTNPVISVAPGSLNYGTVSVGSTNDLTLTVRNTGGGTLSGGASVAAPFSIVSGSLYSLGAGQTQITTVRYNPTAVGSDTQNVTFTGGGGNITPVSGSSTNAFAGVLPPVNLHVIAH